MLSFWRLIFLHFVSYFTKNAFVLLLNFVSANFTTLETILKDQNFKQIAMKTNFSVDTMYLRLISFPTRPWSSKSVTKHVQKYLRTELAVFQKNPSVVNKLLEIADSSERCVIITWTSLLNSIITVWVITRLFLYCYEV